MTPKSLDFSPEFSNYVPENKDQRIVKTPYGKGIVIRTRENNNDVEQKSISMNEIELVNWTKPKLENHEEVSSRNSSNPQMLYTPMEFPSVSPVVGSDVLTQWGRGKVTEIRDDDRKTHVVKLSSWRLASRSSVLCYISVKECEVIKPYRIYDMDVFEKVEYANDLKQQATTKFKKKDYHGALELFARAIDAVRYVQHGADSTNELRADLIVVMITCSNNAALCSSKHDDWGRAAKFGENALVLIEALEEKGDKSKIKNILNSDGIGDSQLFGTWKVKSLLLIAKSQMERHDIIKMTKALKKALVSISIFKKENDSMYKQLSIQEKDIRRLRLEFSKKSKAALQKEKKRARAMFGREDQNENNSEKIEMPTIHDMTATSSSKSQDRLNSSLESLPIPNIISNKPSVTTSDEDISSDLKKDIATTIETEVTPAFTDDNKEDDEDHSEPSFFEEHNEALFILSGIAIGWMVVMTFNKKR